MVPIVAGVGGEEDVLVGARDLAEGGDHPGHVGVTDVVLLAARGPAVFRRRQDHVGLVDVGAMALLGQAEAEHLALLQLGGRLALRVLVVTHPDRAQAQGGDLEGVPVAQPVEADDLGELADPVGVPAAVVGAVSAGVSREAKMRSRPMWSRKSEYQTRSWSSDFSRALPRDSKKSTVAAMISPERASGYLRCRWLGLSNMRGT